MSAELLDPDVVTMSNYSVYFLRQNSNIDFNCSVYSLTSGSIQYQEYSSGTWSGNVSSFLPAYYVTNCSIPGLWAQIAGQNVSATDIETWLDEYSKNPYNYADNGDSFVALLFMLVGSCVSCWMLSLLFVLSPKHKQKPVLTQLAMLFYSIYLTVVFSKVASITEAEYYADSLDMIKILTVMADQCFTILGLVSTLLTQLAYLQLFLKMTKTHWRVANCAVVCVLIVACIVSSAFYIPLSRNSANIVELPSSAVSIISSAFQAVFMLWFAFCLGHYTLFGTATPPKQVAYSKKLLPLAILTWIFVVAYVLHTILLITYWRHNWLTNAWLSYFPNLLAMYILTSSWEWVYSIRHLESQLEIVDMLGRRISLEDVMDFNNDEKVRRAAFRGRFARLLDFFRRRKGAPPKLDSVFSGTSSAATTPVVVDCGNNSHGSNFSHFSGTRDDESSIYEVQYMDSDSWGHDPDSSGHPTEALESPGMTSDTGEHPGNGRHATAEFVSPSPEERLRHVTSVLDREADLPPFRPHPGFSKDDYWDEK